MFIYCPDSQRANRRLRTISWFKIIAIKTVRYKSTLCYRLSYLYSICIGQFFIANSKHHRRKIGIPTEQCKTTKIFAGKPFGTPNPTYRSNHPPNARIIYIIPSQNTLHSIIAIIIFTKFFLIRINKIPGAVINESNCLIQFHIFSATNSNRSI